MKRLSNTDTQNRFNELVDKDSGTSCWFWKGTKNPEGYGKILYNGKLVYAHRYSYQMVFGDIPTNKVIDHICYNRSCVNPEHLSVVSCKDNIKRGGDDHSNYQINDFWKEDNKVFTQQEIVDILQKEGYDISIRTLTYWRENKRIPPLLHINKQWVYPSSILHRIYYLAFMTDRKPLEPIYSKVLEGETFIVYSIHISKDAYNKQVWLQYYTDKGVLIETRKSFNGIDDPSIKEVSEWNK